PTERAAGTRRHATLDTANDSPMAPWSRHATIHATIQSSATVSACSGWRPGAQIAAGGVPRSDDATHGRARDSARRRPWSMGRWRWRWRTTRLANRQSRHRVGRPSVRAQLIGNQSQHDFRPEPAQTALVRAAPRIARAADDLQPHYAAIASPRTRPRRICRAE